jgi:hypothetical protein
MQRYIGLDEMSEELVPDEDWEEKYSEQHKKKFWKNKKTGKSSWTEPPKVAKKSSATEPSATAPSSSTDGSGNTKAETEMIADEDWEEKYSEQHKRKFWKNKKTGKSSWTEPPKVAKKVSVEAASASTTAAPAPAAAVATAAPQSELVPDEDWEEKYSEQHKRKFWKNKKTGKSSWTEPPKVSKVATAEVSEPSKNTSSTEASSTVELVPDEDWEEKYSEQHKRKFWKNKKTGKSSWTEPPKVVKSKTTAGAAGGTAAEAAEELVPDEDWEEKYSEQHKKKFWKNKKSGKSSWTEPPKVAKKSSATEPSATAPSSSTDGSGNTKAETEMVADEDWEEKYSEQHKRKFWKNKKTGKSSWTEPPKVAKKVSVEAASASTTAAPAPAAAVATAAPQSELVPDEDWEEKYSVPHKRKFWKNKKTGKSSWTEPPKVFKTAQPSQQATEAATSAAMADSKSSAVETEAKVETIKEKPLAILPTCGILWTVENGNWSSFPAKLISRERASLLILYREYQTAPISTAGAAFPLIVSSLEDELLNEIAASETSARDLLLGKRKKDAAAEGTGTGTSADGGGQGIQLLLSFKAPHSASASSAAAAVASSSALASFVAKLYCNESPGRLRFVISDGAAFADIDIDKKLPAFSASVATSSTALASAATSAAVTPGKGDAQPGFKSNAATEVILMCSSKTEASLWAKILRTKVSQQQLEIFDRSEFCAGDIDRVTMACILASAKTERACAEIDWLRCLSRALTSSASPSPSDRVMATAQQQQQQQQEQEQVMRSNLKLVEEKVNQQLLKFSSSSSAITDQLSKSLEANRLPGDGLVVVAMTLSSSAPLLFPQHDSHRGNLSHFTGQYLSLWIQLDELNHRLIFYDHGPGHDPCVFFSVSSLTHIILQDLFFEQNFLLELQHCSLLPPDLELDLMQQQEEQQQQQQISAVSVNLSFSFSTALEYWKWALSFANFIQLCKAINKQTSPSPLPLSLDSYSSPTKLSLPFSSHSYLSSSLSHLGTPSRDNGNGSHKGSGVPKWNSFMLDFAMDSINSITDRNMIRRFMKRHSASGSEVRSLRFYSIHNRVIISEAGHTSLRIGSVLITLNGISAIGIPGRSLTELIQDIPSHSSVEIFCWEFPREIFHCQVMATSLKKTSAVTAASAAAVDSWEEQKTNEKTSVVSSSEVDGSKWMTDVRMKLEGDSILFVSGNSHPSSSSSSSSSSSGWRQTLLLSNIRMRLIEVDDETSVTSSASRSTSASASASGHTRPTVVALCVAIELRDKDSKVLISCSSLQVLLDLLCRIFEALKLFGTIGYDLTLFHERCLQYQLLLQAHKTPAPVLSLGLSPAPSSGHYQYSTPLKSPAAGEGAASSGTVALTTATRSDIMRAAQELESVFESLHISDSFPTVKKIHAVCLLFLSPSSPTTLMLCAVGFKLIATSKYCKP